MTDYTGSKTPLEQRNLWQTPLPLFVALDAEFCLTLDAAASADNALCNRYITEEQNTLETPWADYLSNPGYVWLNPPYSDITPFVQKAADESKNQIGTVMLVPADTSVGSGNNKGSMLIIWHPYPRTHCQFTTVERDALLNFGARLIAKREAA